MGAFEGRIRWEHSKGTFDGNVRQGKTAAALKLARKALRIFEKGIFDRETVDLEYEFGRTFVSKNIIACCLEHEGKHGEAARRNVD